MKILATAFLFLTATTTNLFAAPGFGGSAVGFGQNVAQSLKTTPLDYYTCQPQASPPTAQVGRMYFDSTDSRFKICLDGVSYVSLATGTAVGMSEVTSNASQFSGNGLPGAPLTLKSSSVTLMGQNVVRKTGDTMTGDLYLMGSSRLGVGVTNPQYNLDVSGFSIFRSTWFFSGAEMVNPQANGMSLLRLKNNEDKALSIGVTGSNITEPGQPPSRLAFIKVDAGLEFTAFVTESPDTIMAFVIGDAIEADPAVLISSEAITMSKPVVTGSSVTIAGLTIFGSRTAAEISTLSCPGLPCWVANSSDYDVYTATGTGPGQWRNSRLGINP